MKKILSIVLLVAMLVSILVPATLVSAAAELDVTAADVSAMQSGTKGVVADVELTASLNGTAPVYTEVNVAFDKTALTYNDATAGALVTDADNFSASALSSKNAKATEAYKAAVDAGVTATNVTVINIALDEALSADGVLAVLNFVMDSSVADGATANVYVEAVAATDADDNDIDVCADVHTVTITKTKNPKVGNVSEFTYVVDGPATVKQGTATIDVDVVADGLETTSGVWNLYAIVLYPSDWKVVGDKNGDLFPDAKYAVGTYNVVASEDPYKKLVYPLESFPETVIDGCSFTILYATCEGDADVVDVSGTFATLTFEVPADAEIGDTALISVIYDKDGDIVRSTGTKDSDGKPVYEKLAPAVQNLTIEIVSACDHESSTWTTKEATCGEAGSQELLCDNCGKVLDTQEIPATGAHTAGTATPVPATCGADGSTGEVHCTVCDALLDAGTVIPATGEHTPGDPTGVVEPTCTTVGYTGDVACTVCGASISTGSEVAMTAHVAADALVGVKEATCTAKGYTGDVVCKDCGTVITAGQDVAMIAHTPDGGTVVKDPTCAAAGSTEYKCTVCGTVTSTDDTAPAIDPEAHNYDAGVITTPATCTEKGVKTYTCQNDASHTYTEDVAATGHTADTNKQGVVAATCETDGYTGDVVCKTCGAVITAGATVPAIGHNYDAGVVTTEPTCVDEGVKTYTCQNDSTHTYTEPVPATGEHTYEQVEADDSTETVKAYENACTVCGEVEVDENGIPVRSYKMIITVEDENGEVVGTIELVDEDGDGFIDASADDFVVDGYTVDVDALIEEGIITVNDDGTYTIEITENVIVPAEKEPEKKPQTGDAMVYIAIALAVAVLGGAAVVIVRKKREN